MVQVWHGISVFFDNFAEVNFTALGIALGFHLLKLLVRARAWRNILVAAFPGSRVRTRHVLGATAAGIGVNAVIPARGGDAVKLVLVHSRIEGANYPALASSLVAETLFDFVVASCFLIWAFAAGILPGLNVLPHLPAIDWWWPVNHPKWTALIALGLVVVLAILAIWLNKKVDELRARLAQGIAILHTPRRYVTGVVSWQLVSWALRLATVYVCLRAFRVPATVKNALTVQVVDSLATILPFSPGGVGTKQGLIVYMLRGQAPATRLLSLSVGMYVVFTVANVAIGAVALLLMQGSLRLRRATPEPEAG